MSKIKYAPNGHRLYRIICQRCGRTRWIGSPNIKQVKYCKSCYYDIKRIYNSAYVKKWRQQKAEKKKNKGRSRRTKK